MKECIGCNQNIDHFCDKRGGKMKTRQLPLTKFRVVVTDEIYATVDASNIGEAAEVACDLLAEHMDNFAWPIEVRVDDVKVVVDRRYAYFARVL